MKNTELRETLKGLLSEWKRQQPIKESEDRRLWEKFRLEWNYNSNHIEGNTLTYGETELLLFHDRTTGDHTLREFEEMKAHDVGIAHIRKLAREPQDLTEGDIRNLNKIILREPFWKEAITPGGQATRKQIIPGDYKQTPNNVRTATGEIFEFAPPTDVPARMASLVQWLRDALQDATADLVKILARLHHDFVLIHPFDDGNGRVARLLVNYVLLRKESLPIIIKSADKKNYLAALQKADVGDLAALEDYLAKELVWSLTLGLKAARGESVEEPSDIEKEISLFARDQNSGKERVRRKNKEDMTTLYEVSWKPLFQKFVAKTAELCTLFEFSRFSIGASLPMVIQGATWEEQLASLKGTLVSLQHISFELLLEGYTGKAPKPFNVAPSLELRFDDYFYTLWTPSGEKIKKCYSELILSDEAEQIVNDELKKLFALIKELAGVK